MSRIGPEGGEHSPIRHTLIRRARGEYGLYPREMRQPFFRRLPPVGPSKEIPEQVRTRIRTPKQILRGEEQEFSEKTGTEEVLLPDNVPTQSKWKKMGRKVASWVVDPLFWAATYPIRGRFWNKINNFYDHPEQWDQQFALRWALKYSIGENMPGRQKQIEEEPVENLTFGKMVKLARHNRLYRQSLIYAASLLTPVVGPIVSLFGLNIGNTAEAFRKGEIRKGIGYAFLTVADVAPFAISTVLIPFFGLDIKSAGATVGLNVAATFTPTNTFLNEAYENAYTDAYRMGLLSMAQHFLTDTTGGSKREAIIRAYTEFIRRQANKRGSITPGQFRDELHANINYAINQLRGDSDNVGKIEQTRARYTVVSATINAFRHPPEGEKKQRIPIALRVNKIYFEHEIIQLEKKLAGLEQIQQILKSIPA